MLEIEEEDEEEDGEEEDKIPDTPRRRGMALGLLARMQGLSQGSALLGKQVTYQAENGAELTDTVDSVYVNEMGELRLKVGNDDIDMRSVRGIAEPKN